MPCRDGRDTPEIIYRENKDRINKLSAMLCGILTVLSRQYNIEGWLAECDFPEKECGVRQQDVYYWWVQHQIEDKERQRLAEAENRRYGAKKRALAKLSLEDKIILGLK